MSAKPPLIVLGAGGHAKVLLALAAAAGWRIDGVCDPELAARGVPHWRGWPVLGDDEALARMDPAQVGVLNGIGQMVGASLRAALFARFRGLHFRFPAMVHPHAWVAPDVQLAEGAQVMAGAVIQPDTVIGANSIVNTGARIDHDCSIGNDVHIAPGAVLCGAVQVGDGAFIGAGAVLIQGVHVGAGAVVGAGALVLRPVAPGARVLGAKPQGLPR